MEIMTLLRANIRRKKGTFISIMVLMMIIVICMTAILSVRDNYTNVLDEAYAYADCGDSTVFVRSSRLTKELCAAVENSELVERVEYAPAMVTRGSSVGKTVDGNSYFLLELPKGIRLFNENLDGFEEKIPALSEGEIYLPLGLKEKLGCNVGDTIQLKLIMGEYKEFMIKGFVQEPSQGGMLIGWKQVFISTEDMENLYAQYKPLETESVVIDYTMLKIYQNEASELSLAKFQRQLNLETGIVAIADGALTLEQSARYTTLLPEVVTNIVLVFVVFLYVIVLIVMSHSIGSEIETDYVALGILKSQGFSKGKIRMLIMLQYLLAQLLGIVLGNAAALPIERVISNICMTITAVLPERGLSLGKSAGYTSVILLTSVLLILWKTRKIAKISPVRAIAGGREEIFFDSRLNVPIEGKALLPGLSLRQITAAPKRYIGTVFVVAILTFFMLTVNMIGNLLSTRSGLAAMGMIVSDIEIYATAGKEIPVNWEEVEKIITYHSEIQETNIIGTQYLSVNGENLYCEFYDNPEYIYSVLKGRAPLYDNEIVITEMVADALDLKMGNEVTVTKKEETEQFIISGIFQSGSDSGMVFAMNFAGAERLGIDRGGMHYYILEDKSALTQIEQELSQTYGDKLRIYVYDEENNPVQNSYGSIVDALKVLVYSFSVLFAFIVVRMVCTKIFIQERTDIGIYKAMGFTSTKLRWGFAIRFFLIALVGAILGEGLSILFSGKLLGMALSLIGLAKVATVFTIATVLVPIVVISLSFGVFAYLTSRKIKRVAVRELIVE